MPSDELPSLTALRAFEATARLGSASAAAEALHITHGAVSRQIKALENELEGVLFIRQGRRLVLTPSGREFATACTHAFEQLRAARRAFDHSHVQAPLVLTCPGSLLARWLIPRLDRLNHDLPELHLRLVSGEKGLEPLNDDIDASLIFAAPPYPEETLTRRLSTEYIGPVLAPSVAEKIHLDPARPELSLLLKQSLLHTSSRPQAWPEWARSQGVDIHHLQMGQEFEHLYYLLEAAEAGLGIAIAPQLLVDDALQRGHLMAPWGFVATSASLTLVERRHSNRILKQRIKALGDWLTDEFNDKEER